MKIKTLWVVFLLAFCCGMSYGNLISFRWTGSSALNSTGGSLPASSTVLTFLSQDTNINTWSSTWVNSTDAGDYGGILGPSEVFLFATNTQAAGFVNIGTFTQNPSTYGTWHAYAVYLEIPFSTFRTSGVTNGTPYDIVPFSYYILDQSGSPTVQNLNPGAIDTSFGSITVVPEPTTLALIASGMGVVLVRRRKKQATGGEEAA